jgi:photosystem II stability/assembly factor-like uncharacterized protein
MALGTSNPIIKDVGKEKRHDKPEGFIQYFNLIKIPPGQNFSGYESNYILKEYEKVKARSAGKALAGESFMWTHRGPGNVGGRTKQIIIDPDDASHNTWFAASAGGGVWKTTDGGQNWISLTDHLPNLSTNTIVMAPSNHNVLYVGTGEGYGGISMIGGNGIYRSSNKGQSWNHLNSTISNPDFKWVNKLVVDAINPDEILAATNTGLFKSFDGGVSWETVYANGYRVQDLAVNEKDPRTIYATVNGLGIIKSYDNGNTWIDRFEGLGSGSRHAVAVSPVDTNYVFASIEKSSTVTDLFISQNRGISWQKLKDNNSKYMNFLGGQGWYDHVLMCHPFDKNKVFLAGVYIGLIEFTGTTSQSTSEVQRVDTLGTAPFMGFINFGGLFLGGGMSTGDEEDAIVLPGDYSSVELRFGPGMSQKAYRFTVPVGAGSGVAPENYTYHDYIEVPFVAWDTDNNRQLMVSFRDQERDGEFNLIERSLSDDISGREYIFVQAVAYSETPDASIAQDGGHVNKMIYFFWPTLAVNGVWDTGNLPVSKIKIRHGVYNLQDANTTLITDPEKDNPIHVDHHDLKLLVTDAGSQQFMILNANDGGLGVSYNGGQTWSQITDGYHTAQFYGAAKRPYAHEYIGGLQDNGTYQSPGSEQATSLSNYTYELGGDGFEVLWNTANSNRIMASIYNNAFRVSTDAGQTWRYAVQGIQAGDGPFITRLSNSIENPDLIFAVGNMGIYYHDNFGVGRDDWQSVELGDGWTADGEVTSAHNVEVSLADPSIVWAGGGMFEDPYLSLFLSDDYGQSFEPVNQYTEREMGYLSGIATHHLDPATAYALFSIDHRPKILRTTDYGQNWEDISGFGTDSVSSNGFPDVGVYCLLVQKYNPNVLWAGTEIGIIESPDNGENWYYADNGLPAVAIWQMFVQDANIVVATHGRGIWTAPQWPGAIENGSMEEPFQLEVYPNPASASVNLTTASPLKGGFTVQLYTSNGKMIRQQNGYKSDEELKYSLDLSDVPAGNYIVRLSMKDASYTAKVVVSR